MARICLSGLPRRLTLLVTVGAMVAAGCTAEPPAARQTAASRVGEAPAVAPAAPPAPTTLRIDNNKETTTGIAAFSTNNNNQRELAWTFHAPLTLFNARGELEGGLARKIPSIPDGDWKVNPDGTMDVTWRLRPGVKWHDGAPMTADDWVFGYQVARDKELPLQGTGGMRYVRDVILQDGETFVVHWTQPFFAANQGTLDNIWAIPRHIVGALYAAGDKQAFVNSPYWTTQFVGLGPYKLGQWVQGSFTEGLAFDDYFLGRPKIDRLLIRYINDQRVTLASLLSGDIDVTRNLSSQDLVTLKQTWDPVGGGTIIQSVGGVQGAIWQWRDPGAPWVANVQVRQAIVHLLDRQALAETFEPFGGGPADVFASPADAVYRLVEQHGYAKYRFDPARATQLLAEAGWTRGPDGMLQKNGQRFNLEIRANQVGDADEAVAAGAMWKEGGLNVSHHVIPAAAADRGRQRAESQGLRWGGGNIGDDLMVQYTTAEIRSEANNWSGLNQGGYSSPDMDALYARFSNELDPPKRNAFYADFLKQIADEVLQLSSYYTSTPTVFRRGVRGPAPFQPMQGAVWNIHEWEMD